MKIVFVRVYSKLYSCFIYKFKSPKRNFSTVFSSNLPMKDGANPAARNQTVLAMELKLLL